MTAYHGTPHTFEPHPDAPLGKFDLSKIGTGEGAQAYGHGIYLAENPGTAGSYRSALATPEIVSPTERFNPKQVSATDPKRQAYNFLTQAFQNQSSAPYAQARKYAEAYVRNPEIRKDVTGHLNKWQDSGASMEQGGSLYHVDIPDEHIDKMLDWDKRFNDQPQSVQDALRAAFAEHGIPGAPSMNPDGQSVNAWLSSTKGQEYASALLNKHGIPGIKYLDAGSRGSTRFQVATTYEGEPYSNPASFTDRASAERFLADQKAKGFGGDITEHGTRNLVLFDPSIATITKKE
jgi:hypothetical protein